MAAGWRLYTVEDINWDVLPHDNARAAVALYLTGDEIGDVAAGFGVSTASVAAWVNRSRTRSRRSDTKSLDHDELRRALLAGWSREDISAEFGCSEAHLQNEIKRHGLHDVMACRFAVWRAKESERAQARRTSIEAAKETRRQGRTERNACICADYKAGVRLSELAARYGLDPSHVWRILETGGLDTTRNRGTGRPRVRAGRQGYDLFRDALGLPDVPDENDIDLERRIIAAIGDLRSRHAPEAA